MNENINPALQGAQATGLTDSYSWGDVLDAYHAEHAAQSEYEGLVCSLVVTQEPLDWEVMNPILKQRKATHEAFLRIYRLWLDAKTRRNGHAYLAP